MGMEHPNIVKFYQVCYDNRYLNIVMELVQGIPVLDLQEKMGKIPEAMCQIIMRQTTQAIHYFHKKGIVHRDLKLDNLMVSGHDTGNLNDIRVKLIDFGMAKHTNKEGKKVVLSTFCGTLNFMAPEVLDGDFYDESCDVWSLGVMAFQILSGVPPFYANDENALINKILSNNYDFNDKDWAGISVDSKKWIRKLLVLDFKKRSTPQEAIEHVWLSGTASSRVKFDLHPEVLVQLRAT